MLGIEIESESESSGIEIAIWHAYEWKYREMKKATANGLISVCMYVCKYVCKYVERGKEIKSNQIWHAYEWEKYRKKELPNLRMYVCVYVERGKNQIWHAWGDIERSTIYLPT